MTDVSLPLGVQNRGKKVPVSKHLHKKHEIVLLERKLNLRLRVIYLVYFYLDRTTFGITPPPRS